MRNLQDILSRGKGVILSTPIRAGKRIYYLDVRKNKRDELFLTITESRRIGTQNDEQSNQFDVSKIFLYKEDFDCFLEELEKMIRYVKENNTVDFVPSDKKKKKENILIGVDLPAAENMEIESGKITFELDFN